jgi:hypothetical protein
MFTVRNTTEDHFVDVVFVEQDDNRTISPDDQIFIIEENNLREEILTWLIRFTGDDSTETPLPGDSFVLRILKPFTADDVFEFVATSTSVSQTEVNQSGLQFQLLQNYPNPFNPSTSIDFQVSFQSRVKITVYNILGQKIITLLDSVMQPGLHTLHWYGRDASGREVSSGLYFYTMEAANFKQSQKLMLLR